MFKYASVFIITFIFSVSFSQPLSPVQGIVIDSHNQEPLIGANVFLKELKIVVETNENGVFQFSNVTAGNYTLVSSLTGHKETTKKISVPQKEKLIIEMHEQVINLNETIVTGNPFSLDPKELSQATISLSQLDLQIKRNSTLAQSLDFQPGVAMRSNGTAASRPVIRGFSNNMILILEDGLRMGDLSSSSDDHGISDDGSEPEKIEIIRGPASLLYGSNAIGGVVNVITDAIPSTIPQKVNGHFLTEGSSVNNQYLTNLHLNYGINLFSFHGNLYKRKAGDYKISTGGKTFNSFFETFGGQTGVSFHPNWGITGLSFSSFHNQYGLPAPSGSTSAAYIDMKKTQVKYLTDIKFDNSFLSDIYIKGSYQNYHHNEIDRFSGIIGTSFNLETANIDISSKHVPLSYLMNGIFGLSSSYQKYKILGSEAITPNTEVLTAAAYIFEQMKFNKINLSFGLRTEVSKVDISQAVLTDSLFASQKINFATLSGSLGIVYSLSEEQSIFFNAAKAFRSPSADELASYGIHEAANSFDIGNRNLLVENNLGFDLGLRSLSEEYSAELTGYVYAVNNYISRTPQAFFYSDETDKATNSIIGFNDTTGFRVKKYLNEEAVFYSFESKISLKLTDNLATTIIADYVRAKNSRTKENLPQIPPFRISVETRYTVDQFWLGLDAKAAASQKNISINEIPTAGYFLVDCYGGMKFFSGRFAHIISLKIENAFNRKYKDHLSAIKEFTSMPGRNISLSYKFLF
ncbi:MAG: TonB-dependent receptor [Melioribacteraceae bacterium]